MPHAVRRSLLLPLVALAGVMLACGDDTITSPDVPAGWNEVTDCGGGLSFFVAPDMSVVPVQPIDSCVGIRSRPSHEMQWDYGWYSSDLTELLGPPQVDPATWVEDVDGRPARFITSRDPSDARSYVTALAVDDVEPGSGDVIRLSFVSRGATAADRDEALVTFRSVDFRP